MSFGSSVLNSLPALSVALMKKAKTKRTPRVREDIRLEYDFSDGVRGKYAKRFAEGTKFLVSGWHQC